MLPEKRARDFPNEPAVAMSVQVFSHGRDVAPPHRCPCDSLGATRNRTEDASPETRIGRRRWRNAWWSRVCGRTGDRSSDARSGAWWPALRVRLRRGGDSPHVLVEVETADSPLYRFDTVFGSSPGPLSPARRTAVAPALESLPPHRSPGASRARVGSFSDPDGSITSTPRSPGPDEDARNECRRSPSVCFRLS